MVAPSGNYLTMTLFVYYYRRLPQNLGTCFWSRSHIPDFDWLLLYICVNTFWVQCLYPTEHVCYKLLHAADFLVSIQSTVSNLVFFPGTCRLMLRRRTWGSCLSPTESCATAAWWWTLRRNIPGASSPPSYTLLPCEDLPLFVLLLFWCECMNLLLSSHDEIHSVIFD